MGDLPGGVFSLYIQCLIPDGRPTLHREEPISFRATPFHFQLLLGDGSTYPYPGHYRSGDRAVDPQTGTLEIVLDFPNPQAMLLPGIFSRVKIQTGEKS